MPNVKIINLDKINPEPSVNDMKEFGLRFSKKDWEKLSNNKQFIKYFTTDLKKCQEIAISLLLNN